MKREKILAKVNAYRAKHGLGPIDVGFDYPETIGRIMKEEKCNLASIGDRIGMTGQRVGEIKNNGEVPNHISAQLLVGLWKDVFKDYELDHLPMNPQQSTGAVSAPPKRRKYLKE